MTTYKLTLTLLDSPNRLPFDEWTTHAGTYGGLVRKAKRWAKERGGVYQLRIYELDSPRWDDWGYLTDECDIVGVYTYRAKCKHAEKEM